MTDKKGVSPVHGGEAVHGGDVWGASRDLGIPVEEILDLSASLNPLGPPPGLKKAINAAMDLVCHYPDRHCTLLREAVAKDLGVAPDNILPGNGSTALIRMLARVLDFREIMVLAPVFGEFSRALAKAGRLFHYHMLKEQKGYLPSTDDLRDIWKENPSGIIVTNPGTPAGGLAPLEFMNSLLQEAEQRRAWVVLDEAYIDFAPREVREWSPSLVNSHRRLVVLRSMTKFHCLAGLRLGYALGHPATLMELAPHGEPWSVNTLAQAAGVHCLAQDDFANKTRKSVDQWREAQAAMLAGLGLFVFPSAANYLLFRLPARWPDAAGVAKALYAKGILVRDCSNFPGCTDRHVRVAVTTSENMETLRAALAEVKQGH